MGCRSLYDSDEDKSVFYDSTAGVAFGPVMDGHPDDFEAWLITQGIEDPRRTMPSHLTRMYTLFRSAGGDLGG